MSRTHNELSAVVVTIEPLDSAGDPYTPTTLRYRVDDCGTEKSLIGWTALTPATSVQVTIPGSTNSIQDNSLNKPEVKIVTVNADNGLDTQNYSQYSYRVKNLNFAQAS